MNPIDPAFFEGIPTAPAETPGGSIVTSDAWNTAAQQMGATPPPERPRDLPPAAQAQHLSLAERARKRPMVHDFPIPELDDEDGAFVARVRRPSIITLMKSGSIPLGVRKIIDNVVLKEGKNTTDFQQMVDEDVSGSLATIFELVDFLCLTGFVEPKLVGSEEEENSDPVNCMWVDRLPESARMRYYNLVMTDQNAMADGIAPFPGRPGEAVPDRSGGDDVQRPTVDADPGPES